jgi:cation-transporting ATPase 13A3/4/5
LIDEAFHPFYMFQIASLVLWSLDEYYYYAVCIFLISLFSICATIIETQTVCGVRLLNSDYPNS